MNKKIFLFYAIFSLIYCFVLIDRSYFNLSGDNLNIATITLPSVFTENFANDFTDWARGSYYLPLYLGIITFLLKLTSSYILSLQILLFVLLLATLTTTSFALSKLCPTVNKYKIAVGAFLISMAYTFLPSGEIIGFGGLDSALARYIYGIFLPLFILLYCKKSVRLGKTVIPSILLVAALSGLGLQLHPPSAIMAFIFMFCHWGFFEWKYKDKSGIFKKSGIAVLVMITFLILSMTYAIPYLQQRTLKYHWVNKIEKDSQRNKSVIVSNKTKSKVFDSENITIGKVVKSNFKLKNNTGNSGINRNLISQILDQLFFFPFILTVILLSFITRKKCNDFENKGFFIFLKQIFISAYIVNILAVIVLVFISFGPTFYAFKRGDRFLFYIFELLVLYLFFYGRPLFSDKKNYYICSIGAFIFLFINSKTNGKLIYSLPIINQFDSTMVSYISVTVISLFIVCCFMYAKFKNNTKIYNRSIFFTIGLALFWPLICGGGVALLGHLLDSTNGIYSWKVMECISSSKAHSTIKTFDNTCLWVRKNSPKSSIFYYYDKDKAQNLKIGCRRSGYGSPYELGITSDKKITESWELLKNDSTEKFVKFLKGNGITYMVANKSQVRDSLLQSTALSIQYQNKLYYIFKVI